MDKQICGSNNILLSVLFYLASYPFSTDKLFPFVLPWDDSTPSITNISHWLHKPAGKFGHLRVGKDGKIYAGKERIRFFGVSVCFGACFPKKEDAEKIAKRLAKFGINCVRFHHMDYHRAPSGLIATNIPHTQEFDPETLDKLDYFIFQLKQNGIYVNLNTLVSRQFVSADGLPKEIEQLEWKDRHIVGFFWPRMIELQKDYAKKLLLHKNPYTGLTYAEDPAIAFVEINNENGLIWNWRRGKIDPMPKVFQLELQKQWNLWLKRIYGTTEKLLKTWQVGAEPLGSEMLLNPDFSEGLENWALELHGGAEANATVERDGPDGLPAVRIEAKKLGKEPWHIQLGQPKLKVKSESAYTLIFWAKSDKPVKIAVGLQQAHEPWKFLGLYEEIHLTKDWQKFRFTFRAIEDDDNTRVIFTRLGAEINTYYFSGVSFRPGGVVGLYENEKLEDGSIPIFLRGRIGERTLEAQKDWFYFLWETEENYWMTMYRYLKEELKVKAIIIGTCIGFSPHNLMSKFDCISTHAYWQHPVFPVEPWDPVNWYVKNISMVNDKGGAFAESANRRILGKPFVCMEYNHPAPNTFSSEAFLLAGAYAALQDWDGIFAFCYSSRLDNWNLQRIPNFFDIDQHPTKMVTLIPAVMMFRRPDILAAKEQIVVQLEKEKEMDLLLKPRPWWELLADATDLGVKKETALVHRIAIATEGKSPPEDSLNPEGVELEKDKFISDTGQLTWDLTEENKGVVIVNTEMSKAIIGFCGGRKFKLNDVVIRPKEKLQNGWCTITLTVMEGRNFRNAKKILITATGYTENTNMGWKNPEKSTVGRDWGEPPSLVEGINATIILPISHARVKVFSLDERGSRKEKIPISGSGSKTEIEISSQWKTLWYEVSVR